jgi:hypothetical protein
MARFPGKFVWRQLKTKNRIFVLSAKLAFGEEVNMYVQNGKVECTNSDEG